MAAQVQFKVIDLGTNRKRSYGFLLVFNFNLGLILHRFGDIAPYRFKNRRNRPFELTPLSQIALDRCHTLRIFDESYLVRNLCKWAIRC